MKTNSTGQILVRWNVFSPHSNGTYDVTKKVYSTNSQNPFPIESHDLIVTSNPTFINLNTQFTNATYTITAKNNVQGIYALPLLFCGYSSLLVVGLNETEINPVVLYNYFAAIHTCPAFGPPAEQTVLSYKDIISKDITVDITKIPPLKQFEGFVKDHAVICKHGFVSVKKISNNYPACVKPDTVKKLIERGWTKEP